MVNRNLGWLAVVVVLLAVILAGTGSVWVRHHHDTVIELREPASAPDVGQIHIGGAVAAPGWYPLRVGDTLDDLITAAGGVVPGAGSSNVTLIVGASVAAPQRVNINTAGAWLLVALPGIGETKARAVVEYRETNGPFRDTAEIMNVPGIGQGLYDGFHDLITVGE